MAYQENFLDDEKNKQATDEGGQVLSSGNDTGSSMPGSQTASGSTPTSTDKGSGFTNLSQYVNANADQAKGMAEKVTGSLRQQLADVPGQVSSFGQTAQKTAQANTINKNAPLEGALKTNPGVLAQDQWNKNFQAQTAGYKGPNDVTSLAGYNDIGNKINRLDTAVKDTENPLNIGQQLRDAYNRDNYTAGQNTLDNFLATSGEGAKSLANLRNDYSKLNLPQNWQNTVAAGNQALSNAKATTAQTKSDIEAALKQGQVYQEQQKAKALEEAAKARAAEEAAAAAYAKRVSTPTIKNAGREVAPNIPKNKTFVEQTPINIAGKYDENAGIEGINIAPTKQRTPAQLRAILEQRAREERDNQNLGR